MCICTNPLRLPNSPYNPYNPKHPKKAKHKKNIIRKQKVGSENERETEGTGVGSEKKDNPNNPAQWDLTGTSLASLSVSLTTEGDHSNNPNNPNNPNSPNNSNAPSGLSKEDEKERENQNRNEVIDDTDENEDSDPADPAIEGVSEGSENRFGSSLQGHNLEKYLIVLLNLLHKYSDYAAPITLDKLNNRHQGITHAHYPTDAYIYV